MKRSISGRSTFGNFKQLPDERNSKQAQRIRKRGEDISYDIEVHINRNPPASTS